MDESFQLRARRRLGGRQPAALDFSVLAASLLSQQAASPAARAQARCGFGALSAAPGDPLTEILLCGPDWQSAARAQQGCFNRAEVKRRRNLP
ncbi:MAG TPA: hypothetical protein VES64_10830 [Allosphingosinicella sp.]|nr:hypothetical protein [Allosphingosinicella sp.]